MLKIMGITRSSNCALRALTLTYLSGRGGLSNGIARGFIMSKITNGGIFFFLFWCEARGSCRGGSVSKVSCPG